MTLKTFVVFFLILCVKSCESVNQCWLYEFHETAITIDDRTNKIVNLCNTSFNVTKVWLQNFRGNHFPNEVFEKFYNLKTIDIQLNNNLTVLNEKFFSGEIEDKLEKISIVPSDGFNPNYLEKIQIVIPVKFTKLEEFAIKSFKFGTVEKFKGNEKLTKIVLNNNKIEKFGANSFSNLINLKFLYLTGNEIQVLDENLFYKNKKLQIVKLNQNKIREIPRKFFWSLTELEWIDLSSNQIEWLHGDLFKNNIKLVAVDFSRNKIRKISPNLFDNIVEDTLKVFDSNPCTEEPFDDLTNCFKQWIYTEKSIKNDTMVCGQPLQLANRVFGGSQISRGKYPWIAGFYHLNKFECGSSLISSKHILLAAHCIHQKSSARKDPKDCSFTLGKFNLTANEPGSLNVRVLEFILHPAWDANSEEHRADIAVAVLKKIVEFTKFIRPICLNGQKLFNFHDKIGTVVGWGATEQKQNQNKTNDVALEVNVKIHETRECLHLDKDLVHLITPQSFCAGNRNNTGSCHGDSGGSLIVRDANIFKAVGIVSASLKTNDGFCDNSKNQIYTEVAAYHDWIMDRVFVTY